MAMFGVFQHIQSDVHMTGDVIHRDHVAEYHLFRFVLTLAHTEETDVV